MEDLLYRYNPWWEEMSTFESIIERPASLKRIKKHLRSEHIVFLTGLRRIGKTTLLKLLIKDLILKEHVKPEHICFISLDDYLLSKRNVLEIVEEYRKIHKLSFRQKVFLFLDEVSYQKDYETQLKNLYDFKTAKIFASSSSASILKSRKPYLTGRHVTIEILPLDFQEYLLFKQVTISRADRHLMDRYFEDFLKTGGLPEYILNGDMEYLKGLVDEILYKDIVAFHNIKNPQVMKDYFLLLMERAGKIGSINKIAHILKIAPDTAKRYLEMFADAYLVHLVPRCGKTNITLLAPKKVYAADLGVRTLYTGFRDMGSLFENYVYLKIKHLNPCYLYEGGTEIDFMTSEKQLIEVKYGSQMTRKQQDLFNSYPAKQRVILTGIKDLEGLISQ
jgi:predicted AAA+ superfamily ATPase